MPFKFEDTYQDKTILHYVIALYTLHALDMLHETITSVYTTLTKCNQRDFSQLQLKHAFLFLHFFIVAITACVRGQHDYGDKSSGYVVKFDDVSTSYNIKNISAIRNIGRFEIEIDGLYLISACIFSRTISYFSIRRKGWMIETGYMSVSAGSNVAATAVVAIDLKRQDEIWVQTEANFFIHSNFRTSCLTLIKVK